MVPQDKIRNIAIIAHVDHGKDYEFGTNEQGDTSVNFGTRAE